MLDDDRFTSSARGRFRARYGPSGRGVPFSNKKLCLVSTEPAFLSELLYVLSLRADCYFVKYGTVAREGMYLGRCFFTTDEAAGELCKELKSHPRVMASLQDDDWFATFRSSGDANVWDDRPEHEEEVERVVAAAFGRSDEVALVRALRADHATTISLVAGVEPADPALEWPLVGHVVLSPVTLASATEPRGLAVGPLAVKPEFQRRGLGTRLMEAALRRARALGYAYVVVSDLPDFFARFGFRPAAELALHVADAAPHFRALELVPHALRRSGAVALHPAFSRPKRPSNEVRPSVAPALAEVTLRTLGPADEELLANLLELYVHDLSVLFPRVELGPNGRFGYPPLSTYLSGSGTRFAFSIHAGDQVAGFVLVQRGSPVADDPNTLDVAEFFVLRRFREHGVGRAAAALLWARLPGTWTIRAVTRNARAVTFWRGAVAAFTRGTGTEREHFDGSSTWVVFSFDSARQR